jgi:hypothetical protein
MISVAPPKKQSDQQAPGSARAIALNIYRQLAQAIAICITAFAVDWGLRAELPKSLARLDARVFWWPIALGVLWFVWTSVVRYSALSRMYETTDISPRKRRMLLASSVPVKIESTRTLQDLAQERYHDRARWVDIWGVNAGAMVSHWRPIISPSQPLKAGWRILVPMSMGFNDDDIKRMVAEAVSICVNQWTGKDDDLMLKLVQAVIQVDQQFPGASARLLGASVLPMLMSELASRLQAK